MEEEKYSSRIDNLIHSIIQYVDLRVSATKLNIVEKLSLMCSHAFGVIVAIVMAGIALLLFTTAITFILATIINSLVWALIIMGVAYLILMLLSIPLCRRLTIDLLVVYFNKIMFQTNDADDDADQR